MVGDELERARKELEKYAADTDIDQGENTDEEDA
jgi:hypothetical protein